MERINKSFLIALTFLISFTFPYSKEIEAKAINKLGNKLETEDEEEDEIEEEDDDNDDENLLEKNSGIRRKKTSMSGPKVRENIPSKSFSLDDLIELAKKHKTQTTHNTAKKMQYVEEKKPIPAPVTSAYKPCKGVHRKHFMPIDHMPVEHQPFALQFICSKPFINALSCLLSGQKNLTIIQLNNKGIESDPQEKVASLCQHLKLGNSIMFLYIPENTTHKIFGVHLSHLIKQMPAKKACYKRGLSKHVSPSKWVHTISTLPANKKVVRQCTYNHKHCAPLSLKIEKNITQAITQRPNEPLEALRDLFDHGNGVCSAKQIKLTVTNQEKNVIR